MKEDQNTWSKPNDVLGKIMGTDSKIDVLVNVRKFLVDNLVLNQQEKRKFETSQEKDEKKKT